MRCTPTASSGACRTRDGPPTIYLTYDDGPNPTATPALLDVLAAEDVHATFFLIERHITAETEPIVRRIAAEGHAHRPALAHAREDVPASRTSSGGV